jgi:hypothetical protein
MPASKKTYPRPGDLSPVVPRPMTSSRGRHDQREQRAGATVSDQDRRRRQLGCPDLDPGTHQVSLRERWLVVILNIDHDHLVRLLPQQRRQLAPRGGPSQWTVSEHIRTRTHGPVEIGRGWSGREPVGCRVIAACTRIDVKGVSRANDGRTVAITIGISSMAICMPMQARGPAPKGIQAYL